MKLVLISNLYPSESYPTYGTFVKNIVTNLLEEEIEIKMVVKTKSSSKAEVIKSYFQFYLRIFKSFKLVDEHYYYVHYANHSLVPFLLARKNVINKLIVNFHGGDLFPRNISGKILSFFTRLLIPKIQHIIAPSEYLKDELIRIFNISEERIFVSASGGIDINLFRPISHQEDEILDIGFIARLDRGKGFDTLISASEYLQRKTNKFHIHVIGDGEFKTIYQNEIGNLGLTNYFTFYGWKNQTELPKLISQFDIFVFPSHSESLGLVGLEVMACGIPVIGSDVGGIKSYVKDNFNGFLFKPKDVNDLLQKLNNYISLPENLRKELSQNAISTASHYSKKEVGKKLYEHFQTINKQY